MSTDEKYSPPHISYWELQQFLNYADILIVGSGIVGLSTAIHHKKLNPKSKVTVVERGILPSGASTKNAGFACFGSVSEILADLKHSTEDEVFSLVAKRVEGLRSLRNLLGDAAIGYNACGGYEIFRQEDAELFEKCLGILPEFNNRLKDDLNLDTTYSLVNDKIKLLGFEGVDHLLLNKYEGSVDTGKMMDAMLKMAAALGIRILNGMAVSSWTENNDWVDVNFDNGLTIKTGKVHFATNGFAKQLMPELDVQPARAQVLVTSEIPKLSVRGTFHLNEGFYYFRNVGNRILLGGGRNLDFRGEETTDLTTTDLIQNRLEQILAEIILPKTAFYIEHRWAGVMGVGEKKKAIVKQLSDRVSCSVRLGGMGVAIGTLIGKEAAEMLS